MNFILFDDHGRNSLLPFTYTNTAADLLIGMMTNRERWENRLGKETSTITASYLEKVYPLSGKKDNILINARLLPVKSIQKEIENLEKGESLVSGNVILAARMSGEELDRLVSDNAMAELLNLLSWEGRKKSESKATFRMIENVWDFFTLNGEVMKSDLVQFSLRHFRKSSGKANTFLGKEIHIHKSAIVNASFINSTTGPVIIDEGAEVMEGCMLRGPLYIGKYAIVKMGAKIYGPTSVGMHSRVGGEVNNSVINAYSNKAHDGFIGNSVIGKWCNLGADTNTSNLKNDYGLVKLWHYDRETFVPTGLRFLGLIIGDHSKCGINTMFNTGTVVGVSCNLFGSGYHNNFIPSFSWGKPSSYVTYDVSKALSVALTVMERREIELKEDEKGVMRSVFEQTNALRQKFNKVS